MSAAVHRFIRFVPVKNLQDCFVAYAPQIAANTDWKQDDKNLRVRPESLSVRLESC